MKIQTYDESSLNQVVERAKKNIRRLARDFPDLFPEYGTLQSAQEQFEIAKQRLVDAQAAWDRIRK